MPTAIIIIAVLILVILILLITNIKIVPQSMVFVVERLGAYQQTWETGRQARLAQGAGGRL